jgi:TatD DNase family protein
MIDTHAHLDFPEFDKDREEVIQRFFSQGGTAIINIGVDLERSRKSIEIAERHEKIFATIGFHPHEAGENKSLPDDPAFEELKTIAQKKKVKAIGEIGLDYFYYKSKEQIELQKELFLRQIKIADDLNLPVVVHCRDAWEDLYEMISEWKKNKFVLHCYSGGAEDTEKFLKLQNVFFSFSGNITYPKPEDRAKKLSEAVQAIPLDRMMLDSDSPFLAPQSQRGKRNEPIFIEYIAKKVSEIKKIEVEKVIENTTKNAIDFFQLPQSFAP